LHSFVQTYNWRFCRIYSLKQRIMNGVDVGIQYILKSNKLVSRNSTGFHHGVMKDFATSIFSLCPLVLSAGVSKIKGRSRIFGWVTKTLNPSSPISPNPMWACSSFRHSFRSSCPQNVVCDNLSILHS